MSDPYSRSYRDYPGPWETTSTPTPEPDDDLLDSEPEPSPAEFLDSVWAALICLAVAGLVAISVLALRVLER